MQQQPGSRVADAAGEVAERVRKVVEAAGCSQREFARRIVMDPSKLSRSLSGSRRFTVAELARVADAGEVDAAWLLGTARSTPPLPDTAPQLTSTEEPGTAEEPGAVTGPGAAAGAARAAQTPEPGLTAGTGSPGGTGSATTDPASTTGPRTPRGHGSGSVPTPGATEEPGAAAGARNATGPNPAPGTPKAPAHPAASRTTGGQGPTSERSPSSGAGPAPAAGAGPAAGTGPAAGSGPVVGRPLQIVRETVRLIAEHGFHAVRVSDIAAACDTSTAAIHYHFPGRAELLEASVRWCMDEDTASRAAHLADAAGTGEGDAAHELRQLIALQTPRTPQQRRQWLVWLDLWAEAARSTAIGKLHVDYYRQWRTTVADVLRRGIAQGVFRPADPESGALRLTALIDGLASQVLASGAGEGTSADDMHDALLAYVETELSA